jgi:uncharacterized protein YbaR (Trm112 family)
VSEPVILVCPVCASPMDAHAGPQPQTFTCATCGQHWSMVVDARRHAEYALH